MNWRVTSQGHIYQCNESTVVYFDTSSGNTHLLSEFAVYLIQILGTQSLSLEQIITQVLPDIDQEDLPDINRVIPELLGELVALDVIEQH